MCSASGRGKLILGDSQGFINLVDRDFTARAFQAHKRTVQLIQQLKQQPVLITLGADDDAFSHTVKLWDMEKEERSGDPICLKTIQLQSKSTTTNPVRVRSLSPYPQPPSPPLIFFLLFSRLLVCLHVRISVS